MRVKIKDIKRGQNDRQIDSPAMEEAAIRTLAASIQSEGLLQPPVVSADLDLVAGFRRLAAMELLGCTECEVRLVEGPLTETKKRIIRLTENLQRADLTAPEKSLSLEGLLELNPGWTNKELAAHLHIDQSSVTRYRAYRDGTPEVQQAYLSGQIDLTKMYAIAKLPLEKQSEVLTLALCGASRDAIEQAGRRKRSPAAATVRLSRIKAMLPSGVVIVASGEGLTLDDLIESLAEAQREARKAREQGLDARTFQAVLRQKAKKG
jgi:ParB family chromosome partitioning protein